MSEDDRECGNCHQRFPLLMFEGKTQNRCLNCIRTHHRRYLRRRSKPLVRPFGNGNPMERLGPLSDQRSRAIGRECREHMPPED